MYMIGDAMIALQDLLVGLMFIYSYSQCNNFWELKVILTENGLLRNTIFILLASLGTVPVMFWLVYNQIDPSWTIYIVVFSFKISLTAYCLERLVKYRVGFSDKERMTSASKNGKSSNGNYHEKK